MVEERLQKILAQWGIASRRQAEELIVAGRVYVNGEQARLGQKANSHQDHIAVDGQRLERNQRPETLCLLLHKPSQVVSTCSDPQGRKTVLDLLPQPLRQRQGMHPIGRLDACSTGAILLTNDGDLTFRLTHPRHHVAKVYEVVVRGNPAANVLRQWRQGVLLEGRMTQPATVQVMAHEGRNTRLKVVLREGRNRQIRKVAQQLGHPVVSLHRIAIGDVQLGRLPTGQYRLLSHAEIEKLRHS